MDPSYSVTALSEVSLGHLWTPNVRASTFLSPESKPIAYRSTAYRIAFILFVLVEFGAIFVVVYLNDLSPILKFVVFFAPFAVLYGIVLPIIKFVENRCCPKTTNQSGGPSTPRSGNIFIIQMPPYRDQPPSYEEATSASNSRNVSECESQPPLERVATALDATPPSYSSSTLETLTEEPEEWLAQQGAAKPSSSQQGAAKPSSSQQGAAKPSSSQQGAAKPSSSQQGAAKPSSSQQGAAKPSSSQQGAAKPSSSQQGAAKPSSSQQGAVKPSSSQLGVPKTLTKL